MLLKPCSAELVIPEQHRNKHRVEQHDQGKA